MAQRPACSRDQGYTKKLCLKKLNNSPLPIKQQNQNELYEQQVCKEKNPVTKMSSQFPKTVLMAVEVESKVRRH